MENLYLKVSLRDDAREVCPKDDVREQAETVERIAQEPAERQPSRENEMASQSAVFKELERGERFAREKIESSLMREKVLENFAKLREIVESALAKQNEVVLVAHRLAMAIVESNRSGFQEALALQEAKTRARISQILEPFSDLDEE